MRVRERDNVWSKVKDNEIEKQRSWERDGDRKTERRVNH
jgi:hypothetical protein